MINSFSGEDKKWRRKRRFRYKDFVKTIVWLESEIEAYKKEKAMWEEMGLKINSFQTGCACGYMSVLDRVDVCVFRKGDGE